MFWHLKTHFWLRRDCPSWSSHFMCLDTALCPARSMPLPHEPPTPDPPLPYAIWNEHVMTDHRFIRGGQGKGENWRTQRSQCKLLSNKVCRLQNRIARVVIVRWWRRPLLGKCCFASGLSEKLESWGSFLTSLVTRLLAGLHRNQSWPWNVCTTASSSHAPRLHFPCLT